MSQTKYVPPHIKKLALASYIHEGKKSFQKELENIKITKDELLKMDWSAKDKEEIEKILENNTQLNQYPPIFRLAQRYTLPEGVTTEFTLNKQTYKTNAVTVKILIKDFPSDYKNIVKEVEENADFSKPHCISVNCGDRKNPKQRRITAWTRFEFDGYYLSVGGHAYVEITEDQDIEFNEGKGHGYVCSLENSHCTLKTDQQKQIWDFVRYHANYDAFKNKIINVQQGTYERLFGDNELYKVCTTGTFYVITNNLLDT